MLIIVICLLMEEKCLKLPTIRMLTFQLNFVSGVYLYNEFSAIKSREVFLNENVYNFSVDCKSVDKSDILNIHKYLMAKNNIK